MTPLSQRDARWANVRLGNSNLLIKSYGCVVTCLAMLSGKTPTQVNNELKAHGGFYGPLVVWQRASEILNLPYKPIMNRPISYPCIAEVRLSGMQHFVVMIDEVNCLDPIDGSQKRSPYSIRSWRNIGQANTPPPPAPPPASGWPKDVRVKEPANVRSQPRLSAPLSGSRTLSPGDVFRGVELVEGDTVSGNNKWVKSWKGNYVWTGNLEY